MRSLVIKKTKDYCIRAYISIQFTHEQWIELIRENSDGFVDKMAMKIRYKGEHYYDIQIEQWAKTMISLNCKSKRKAS
jgi:hypothetical protein